ncbi:SDR family oxidoreductase [Psychrobacter sp. Ps7]|uniref:SDR family NAD(P)-dependent oxidoreductase n=1 Tax=Psychrobacter sp. Ps7 TaxID=2790961 RepID=UPI001EDD3E3F|nr:SDR family oxidoreductase [Psychrobacter sp. Ps7]MCG3873659.1 SDR family oxidoreductase [Psychrobacter sp. Ps7]
MKTIQQLFDFHHKTIIISGAAGAIGSEAARFLSSLGGNIVLADLNEDKVKQIAADIEKETGNATLGLKTDFTDETQIAALVDATIEKFGKISAVVNNVGWGANTPLWESTTEKMVNAYKLNTLGSYHLTRLCMPYLKQEENASVVFSGSMVGNTPSPEFIEYSTAKAGLLNMVKSMAVASGPEVRFNSLIIGTVDNGASSEEAGYTQEMIDNVVKGIVLKRRGVPADIAQAMAFLLSDAASWITGAELTVNGGGVYKSKMPTS